MPVAYEWLKSAITSRTRFRGLFDGPSSKPQLLVVAD
jgi:hypothetical protein